MKTQNQRSSDDHGPRARKSEVAAPQTPQLERANESLPRLCVSVKEAAEMLNVAPISVYRLLQRGLLKSSTALRHKLIPVSEIHKFLTNTTT